MIEYFEVLNEELEEIIFKFEMNEFENSLINIYMSNKNIHYYVYKVEDRIVGYISFKEDIDYYEIYNLVVVKENRKQKIATKLLNCLTCKNTYLDVKEDNIQAINLYEKNGFLLINKRNNYYKDKAALIYERKSMKTLEKAYAKINLILNVFEKMNDGYHRVDFLMHSLELHDDVEIEKSKKDEVVVIDNVALSSEDNLAYKALKLMKEKYGIKNNYKITITKRIPVAAGMAG